MSKKTTKRLITLIISFLAIIFLQFAFSSPGAAAQTDVIKEPAPLLPSDNQDGTPGVQQLPADWAAHAVTGEAQPGGERAPSVGLAPEGWETIMTQGFEGAWPASGWSLYGVSEGVYERLWGDDNYRSYSGNWSAWPVAGGPDGGPASVHLTYPNDTESWMIYGPFDLSDASAAEVQFQLWREIELGYDWAFFGVSGEALGPFNGFYYDGFQDWTQYTYPLNDYVGDNSVYVAWEFYSDSSVYYGGPFVDDIVISKFIDPPVADFNGTPRSGTRPLAVNFSDQSTGSVSSYSWSFGDGGSIKMRPHRAPHELLASNIETVTLWHPMYSKIWVASLRRNS